MDYVPAGHDHAAAEAADQRGSPRYTSLIRTAKLVSSQGEFVCVVRDVSSTGISIRTFHQLPLGEQMGLELPGGECFELIKVREDEQGASFTFDKSVSIERLIHNDEAFPRRQLRLNIAVPLIASTLTQRCNATSENLSQQGAMIACDAIFAVDQTVRLEGEGLPELRAKVRWRKGGQYGLAFENFFSLSEFAQLAAMFQCPSLITAGRS